MEWNLHDSKFANLRPILCQRWSISGYLHLFLIFSGYLRHHELLLTNVLPCVSLALLIGNELMLIHISLYFRNDLFLLLTQFAICLFFHGDDAIMQVLITFLFWDDLEWDFYDLNDFNLLDDWHFNILNFLPYYFYWYFNNLYDLQGNLNYLVFVCRCLPCIFQEILNKYATLVDFSVCPGFAILFFRDGDNRVSLLVDVLNGVAIRVIDVLWAS